MNIFTNQTLTAVTLTRWNLKSSVQSLSHVRLFATPWTTARQASLSITNSWSLLKLMPIELMMPSNHFILCRSLLLLPSIFPSIRVFSNESALCIRWSRFWSFSFNISPSSEHSGLISFRMDWCIPWSFPNTGSYDARNASTLFTFVTDFFVLDLTVTCMKWLN